MMSITAFKITSLTLILKLIRGVYSNFITYNFINSDVCGKEFKKVLNPKPKRNLRNDKANCAFRKIFVSNESVEQKKYYSQA
jgi:hypothetical protein